MYEDEGWPRPAKISERRDTIAGWIRDAGKKGLTAPQIHFRLLDELNTEVTIKTVQRDLNFLRQCKCAEPRKDPEHGAPRWLFVGDAEALMPDRSSDTKLSSADLKSARVALGIVMLYEQASHLLPLAALNDLREHYERSKRLLTRLAPQEGRWLGKLVTGTQHVQLHQAVIDPQILEQVQLALLGGYQLAVRYFANNQQEERDYELHPLGLSYQDSSIYLVCHSGNPDQIRCLPLHRFRKVRPLESRLTIVPRDFQLQNHVQRILIEPEPITLKLRINDRLRQRLDESETPLTHDQIFTPLKDGWYHLECRIAYTQGLLWWILSHGATVEVLEPPSLRAQVREIVRSMASFYLDDVAEPIDSSPPIRVTRCSAT
jgi:predicted DNA-binding transcriptional regulator YafY